MSNCVVSGVWLFNSDLTSNFDGYGNTFWVSDTDTVEIAFTSNGTAYTRLEQGYYLSRPAKRLLYANSDLEVRVYGDESGYFWENEAYRTVDFGTTAQEVSEEFYTWFTANATPIPVLAPTLDPLSMWLGWKAGNWVARQRGKKAEEEKTPIAYLYNGVQLPDINAVWTDEMKALYPYAYMYEMAGFGAYMIAFASFEMYKDGKQIFTKTAGEVIHATYLPGMYDDWYSDGIAQEVKENELAFDEEEDQFFTAISWTSHDILNTDGSVYLAASEPVPVYE